jgi:hypothetical protein
MQPYVIKQGDYLLQLAYSLGFDADSVWNDPTNSDLRTLRSNPAILFPGDLVQVPTAPPSPPATLVTGSANNFTSSPPTVTLTQTFAAADGTPYASMAFTVQELPDLTGQTTDGNGTATLEVPVTLDTATLTFTDTGEVWVLQLGQMDPINTLSGIFKRLQNLNYVPASTTFDPSNLDLIRMGLLSLKASQGVDAPSSSPSSTPAPSSAPASGSASTPPPSSAPSSTPPSSSNAQSSAPCAAAGLSDDGTLDDATSALLLKVHGC